MPLVPKELWMQNLNVGETFRISPTRVLRISNACLRLNSKDTGTDVTSLILDGITDFLTGQPRSCTLLHLSRNRHECMSVEFVLFPGQEYGLKLVGKDGMDLIGHYMEYEEPVEVPLSDDQDLTVFDNEAEEDL